MNDGYYDEEYYTKGTKSGYGGKFSVYNESLLPCCRFIARELLHMLHPKKVLDLGCARGYFTQAFRELGIEAYGIDISKWAIANAPDMVKPYIYQGDIIDLSRWKDKEFDLVIGLDVLEHIEYPKLEKVLDEIVRVSKNYIYTRIPIKDNGVDKSHVSIFKVKWWKKRFNNRGFIVCHDRIVRQVDNLIVLELLMKRNT